MDQPDGVGFTGTQRGMSDLQDDNARKVTPILLRKYGATARHGDCIGSDAQWHRICQGLTCWLHVYPPENKLKRAYCKANQYNPEKGYIDRNHDIVDDSLCLLATPGMMIEELRSGTWATIRYARKRGRPVYILWPDGKLTFERESMRYEVDVDAYIEQHRRM